MFGDISYSLEPCPHISCGGVRRRFVNVLGINVPRRLPWLCRQLSRLWSLSTLSVNAGDRWLAPTLGFLHNNIGCSATNFFNLVDLSRKTYIISYNEYVGISTPTGSSATSATTPASVASTTINSVTPRTTLDNRNGIQLRAIRL